MNTPVYRFLLHFYFRDTVLGPDFESQMRKAMRREAPYYDEYKASGPTDSNLKEGEPKLPIQPIEEILETAVFNLIQEMSANYIDPETRDHWNALSPVQPTAFINVGKYKEYI
jgi:hypothetical protein